MMCPWGKFEGRDRIMCPWGTFNERDRPGELVHVDVGRRDRNLVYKLAAGRL